MDKNENTEWRIVEVSAPQDEGESVTIKFINKFDSRQTMTVQQNADNWLRNLHADWKLCELLKYLEPVLRIVQGRLP